MRLVFRSSLEIRSDILDPDSEKDEEVMDAISDDLQDRFRATAFLLKRKYPQYDLDITIDI